MSKAMRIAFIGLGRMGHPMAGRLAAAKHEVCVWDASPKVRSNTPVGAISPPSLGECVRSSDAVILMVPDGTIVRRVLFEGESPVVESLDGNPMIIDMSSSDPVQTQETGKLLSTRNLPFLDAPVSGGVKRAETGALAIMLGADNDRIAEKATELLSAIGSVRRTGPLGSGHAMKALNNYVSAAGLTAACEAIGTAKAFGLDANIFLEVLNASTGRNVATETKIAQHVLSGEFAAGFSMALMAKDLTTAEALAKSVNSDTPGIMQLAAAWREASEAMPEADHTEIARLSGAAP